MCGLWGYSGEGTPDKSLLEYIVKRADERGGHGYGYFYVGRRGNQGVFRAQGRAEFPRIWPNVQDAVMIIGHSRLITSADRSLFNSQPVLAPDLAVVHNGNIENHNSIMDSLGYSPRTELDSEALVPMIRFGAVNPDLIAAYMAIKLTDKGPEFIYNSNGLPLFKKVHKGGTYYSSKPFTE